MAKKIVDVPNLIRFNRDFAKALEKGEKWAVKHMRKSEELNSGNPYAFERNFDGKKRRWCGGCSDPEGCVVCLLH